MLGGRCSDLGEEVGRRDLDAHIGRRVQDPAHVLVRERVRLALFADRVWADPGGFGEPGLGLEPLWRGQMIDHVDIGHDAPILSTHPIIASPDLSEARRYGLPIIGGMTVGERIKTARKAKGWTQTQLAEAIGLGAGNQSVISEMEAGKLKNWRLHRSKIIRALGQPGSYFEPEEVEHIGNTPDLPEAAISMQVVTVPEYDVRLSAGPGFLNEHESIRDVWQFSHRYLVDEMRLRAGQLAVVQVEGDSMEPTLRSGDRVLVDHSDRNPARPGVFAIWDSGATVVKRLERVPASDPPQITLLSDNPHHKEYTVPADLVNVIGRVVWVARRL